MEILHVIDNVGDIGLIGKFKEILDVISICEILEDFGNDCEVSQMSLGEEVQVDGIRHAFRAELVEFNIIQEGSIEIFQGLLHIDIDE
jgi:hypothetical protein